MDTCIGALYPTYIDDINNCVYCTYPTNVNYLCLFVDMYYIPNFQPIFIIPSEICHIPTSNYIIRIQLVCIIMLDNIYYAQLILIVTLLRLSDY